jgi:hypothetical protein
VHAPDPFRPRVKIIATPSGEQIAAPYEVNLWEASEESSGPKGVKVPLDPGVYGIDPLGYL